MLVSSENTGSLSTNDITRFISVTAGGGSAAKGTTLFFAELAMIATEKNEDVQNTPRKEKRDDKPLVAKNLIHTQESEK